MVFRLIFTFFIAFVVASCGTEDRKKRPIISSSQTSQTGEDQPGTATTTTTQTTVSQNGTVVPVVSAPPVFTTVPVITAVSPDTYSRAVATTPYAVECIDAFIGQGYPEAAAIEYAVARNAATKFGRSIAVGDYNQTAVQVLNVITVDSCFASVDLRLYNPLGYYCIVANNAFKSDVTIQRNCSAKLISLDSTVVTKFGRNTSTLGSRSVFSDQNELPCVP